MNLGQIRNILTNFIERDWSPAQMEAELDFAQLRYFDIARKMDKDLYQFEVKLGEEEPPLYVTNGLATIPTDYHEFISMTAPLGGEFPPIRKCDSYLFDYLRQSPIEFPTADYPICRFFGTQIQFLPTTIIYVNFMYYKTPQTPVFGYTTTYGAIEYNSATSTELDWHEDDQIAIMQIVLQDLGVIVSTEQIKEKANAGK